MTAALASYLFAAPFILAGVGLCLWLVLGISVEDDDPHQDPDNLGRQ